MMVYAGFVLEDLWRIYGGFIWFNIDNITHYPTMVDGAMSLSHPFHNGNPYNMDMYIYIYLVGGIPTPLKNMSSSVGITTFPIDGKIKFMSQTTNQIWHDIDDQVWLIQYGFIWKNINLIT